MVISVDETRRIAGLARLEFQPDELEQVTRQLGTILDYVERLREVDTDSVDPDTGPPAGELALRVDQPRAGLDLESALQNAPASIRGHFRVPRVLG